MKKIFFGLFLFCQFASAENLAMEKKYIENQNLFIKKFKASKELKDNEDESALNELEQTLRAALGPIEIPNFVGNGKINLETLQQDGGFGQISGLRFESTNETVVITTELLLSNDLADNKEMPTHLEALAKNSGFYSKVFSWNSTFSEFAEIPLANTKSLKFARAFLMLNAQDIGPFIPNELVIFFAKGNRVVIARCILKEEVTQITSCKEKWEHFNKMAASAFSAYQASGLKDKKSFDDYSKYEAEGFKSYRQCFEINLKNEKSFPSLKKMAQSILDGLQNIK